jgi:hypothetical protein
MRFIQGGKMVLDGRVSINDNDDECWRMQLFPNDHWIMYPFAFLPFGFCAILISVA